MTRAACVIAMLLVASGARAQTRMPTSLRALPPIDATTAPDFAAALPLVDRALRLHAPHVLERTPQQDLARKVREALGPWLQRRVAATHAAETALQAAAQAHPGPAHSTVAAAFVGILWESFASEIAALPAPRAIRSQPDVLATYQELLDEQVAPLREQARVAFAACAQSGLRANDATLAAWTSLCGTRASTLSAGAGAGP